MRRTAGKEEEEEPDAIGNVEASVWLPVSMRVTPNAPVLRLLRDAGAIVIALYFIASWIVVRPILWLSGRAILAKT